MSAHAAARRRSASKACFWPDLARDGGLYVPASWPRLDHAEIAAFAGRPYAEVAARVLHPFMADWIGRDELSAITRDAYATFRHMPPSRRWSS